MIGKWLRSRMAANVTTGTHTRPRAAGQSSIPQPQPFPRSLPVAGEGPWRTARAEELASEAAGLGVAIAGLNAAAWSAGVDPPAVRGITGAALSLAAPPRLLWARSRVLRDDVALREAAADFEHAARSQHRQGAGLLRDYLATGSKAAAIAANRDATPVARRIARARAADCEAAAEILTETAARLKYAARVLSMVPDDFAECYQAAYALRDAGHELPAEGEWLTGTSMAVNG